MYVGAYGWYAARRLTENSSGMPGEQGDFMGIVRDREGRETAEGRTPSFKEKCSAAEKEQEEWEEKLQRWDQEMERIREENKRYREWMQERREARRRMRKKLREKLALKEHLARQDEISQLKERLSLERALGEDVYIEKAPLSRSLSAAELMALCGN